MVLLSLTVLYVSLRLTAADPPSELKHGGCIKVNECKCLMRDGSGLIDLGSVADEDGFIQRLKPLPSAPQTPDVLLSFSPCLAFSEPERFGGTDCTGVAVCVSRRSGDRCSPNRSVTSSVSLSERALLQMWVESPCACPNACALVDVGPGTILLIILCISVTAYFIIGHSASLAHLKSSRGHYSPINKSKLIIANGYGTPLQDHVRSGRSGRVMVFRWLQKTVFGVRSAVS